MSKANHSPAPTSASTNPMGNTSLSPTPLATDNSPHVDAKARTDHPQQYPRIREHVARKHTQSGHARNR